MGENRPMADLYKENQRLKARISELEGKHWNECRQIAHYDDELRKAKQLLKAAVEDMRWVNENTQDADGTCIMRKCEGCGDCPLNINGDLWCKWKHEAEALALIGKDVDVPASADDTNVSGKIDSWIRCKDRMPEVNEPVLFIFNTESGFKAVMYGWHETIKGLGSGWHQAGVGGARADEEVTYWQPLPEPPKDGEQND